MRYDLLALALALTAAMPADAFGQHILHGDTWKALNSPTDEDTYVLNTPATPWIPLQDSKRAATHWKRGAVIGGVVGFVIGAPVGYATFDQEAFDAGAGPCGVGPFGGCPAEPLSRAGRTLVGGVVGASFGFLLGAFIGRQINVEITPVATRGMSVRVGLPH